MRNQTASIIGAVGIGLVVGACSSGSSTTGSSSASTSPASSKAAAPATTQASGPAAAGQASGTATVSLASISGIPDKVLVGSNGRTMYLFEGDKSGASACSGACAAAWPPVTVSGTPKAGSGVNQALLGTVKRPNGTVQLAYHGHPLYYFTADTAAGTAHGQGIKAFGSEWYVVSASGSEVDTS
jgi:predicted lipoprotein with Yx(FWY)xxD motif